MSGKTGKDQGANWGRVIDPPKLYVMLPQHSHMSEIYSRHR